MIGWLILILMLVGAVSFTCGLILTQMPIIDNSAAIFIIGGAGIFGSGLLILICAGIVALM